MPQIKIEDLPALEALSPEEQAAIVGAGPRFAPAWGWSRSRAAS